MNISENSIVENISLQAINPNKSLKTAYGFLGSRANRFTDFYGYDFNGNTLVTGISNLNNNSVFNLLPAVVICQYDPNTHDAVLSTLTNGSVCGLEHFIWDRPQDNKLYARFKGMECNCDFTINHDFQQRLDFFNVPPADIYIKVKEILDIITCPDSLAGDINKDCQVNLLDFVLLAEDWMVCTRQDCNEGPVN